MDDPAGASPVTTATATPGDAIRRRLVADPADIEAYADGVRTITNPFLVFGWFRRLTTLTTTVDGYVVRRALGASRAVGFPVLRKLVDASPPFVTHRSRLLLPFLAAALLSSERVDMAALSKLPMRFDACRSNFERVLAVLSEKTIPTSIPEALEILVFKQHIAMMLGLAGLKELAGQASRNVSLFIRRIRRNLYGTEFRGFTDLWTFAIGHMVVLAFLLKGQEAGVMETRGARIWKGKIANAALWERIRPLSSDLRIVPPFSVFADNHYSSHLEWIDDRFVDYFTACGIIADRAGDAGGAILERPDASDPALVRFREAAGIAPESRIVTVHCRDSGFHRGGARDVDIRSYLAAISALTACGYTVVRLGDPSMSRLPPMAGVFDYAHSALKSADLDVLLPAIAEFHIGSSSGLSLVPLLFGTPCLFLNWYPFDLLPWGRRNWTVLKPYETTADGRRVVDHDTYASIGHLGDPQLLQALGYRLVDLDEIEVAHAVDGFVASLANGPAKPDKTGPNLSRIRVAGDDGTLQDLA